MKQYFRIFAFGFFLSIFSVAGHTQISPSQQDAYRIGYQDVVQIAVAGHSRLSARVAVNPNGMIYLDRLDKPVKAVCKTERELTEDLEKAYLSYLKRPVVTVTVAEQRSQAISIIGAVDKPGRYPVSRRIHLLEALALAGGPTKESGTRLLIARAGSESNCQESFASARQGEEIALIGFKIRDIQEGRKSFWMLPGDIVSVLESDVVYVYGNVEKPGEIRVREPITLTQAIASSQGLKPAAEKDKVRILRQKPDSIERLEIVLNLRDIEKGKANDPYLEPNDIVAVSKDGTKAIMDGLIKTITGGIPSLMQRTVAPY